MRFSRPVQVAAGIPSPTLSYRLGEAGRSEWVPFANVGVGAVSGTWPDVLVLEAGLRTRWWLSGSSSVHGMVSVYTPVYAPWYTPPGGLLVARFWAPSVGAGYSVTLGEVVTLGIGIGASTSIPEHNTGRLPDGTLVEVEHEFNVGLRIGGGYGSTFPLLSVHLNEVWSLTGNASLAFSLRDNGGMSNSFSAGVLATF
ncbi:hypothetical protein ACN28E_39120 [Archangium lansingense]|uniref:hypothetical protein n=1 Tax=Archangium lansingense TaxID=2995310 RepID=UPI003B79A0EE